ncbi:MAG: hypothetical protein Q7S55_02320 [Nanoarchaeota archaeon]|nr:hypothetical protein [Nanoarchaeota archaeon]
MKKALIGLALMLGCNTTPKYDTTAAKLQLARCLVDKGAAMYGAEGCGYCNIEKAEFGEAWKILEPYYVECNDDNMARCIAEATLNNRLGYPTWKFKNGKMVRGYSSNFLEVLANESGCDN